tara:strand:- start:4 stop:201 length:198 start_codon:yes stop_codon:yes gene_type:complete
MKMLNVRFSDTQRLKIDDTAKSVELDFSKVSRAAMRLGIQQIITLAAQDPEKAKELVLINDAMAK